MIIALPLITVLVGAWLYRWVDEDAFINFRIISNLVAGHGPVYNVGERVETYSDPLWVGVLAFLRLAIPQVAIEWWSVFLGLVTTACGVVLGGRAIQRLSDRGQRAGVTIPVGLVMFSVVAGVWEFVTSGLEMGMVFLWLGLTFWLLVRLAEQRKAPAPAAIVASLGTLIRPELVLMSGVMLVAVGLLVGMRGWKGSTGVRRRWGLLVLAAIVVPGLYEVWRMAYFALLVPNTGLAKAAGSSWWSQGLSYLWNFISPYTLWLPLALAAPFVVLLGRRFWQDDDRVALVVLGAPLVAALVDTLYVVEIGGDYMHARLLLPAFFALSLVISVRLDSLHSWLIVPTAGICLWAVICGGWLRNTEHGLNPTIINSRNDSITIAHKNNPVTAGDYRASILGGLGTSLRTISDASGQRMLVNAIPFPARSPLPFQLAVSVGTIGVVGYLAGPGVYVFDAESLANPIGSHTTTVLRFRPGHEKPVSPVWMYGRFGLPGEDLGKAAPGKASVRAARHALNCAPLSSYLHAITAPFGASQAVSNIFHSLTYTAMTFSPNPVVAERQLCK